MLRIFPLLLQLGANVVSELRGLPATLAFWQAARDPGHIARLVLLLTLAMALGSLSSGLNLALDQNEKDRAYYTSGSDIRVQLASEDMRIVKEGVLSDTTIAIQSVNGFRSLSSVVRTTGSLQFTIENAYPAFDVLAIEPGSLQAVSQFRHDFASVPVIDLLDRLEQAKAEEMPYYELPGHPSKIGIWILVPFEGMLYSDQLSRHTSISLDELSLIMKISTSQGEFISVPLSLDAPSEHLIGGWQYFEGLLPSLNTLSYPVKIHSLWFRHLESSSFLTSIIPQLAIDGMTVVDGLTGATTMPGVFESGGPKWISSDPAIHLSMDGLYPKFGKGRLLLDFGLSGTDITDWIGVNLTKEAFQFEHDEPTQIAPGRDEALTDEGYIMSLPGQPTRLGIWVVAPVAGRFEVGPGIFHPVGELSTVDLQVRLRTRTGEELLLPMQSMGEQPQEGYIQDQWQQFWTDITGIAEDQYPLTLEAFRVRVAENTYLPVLVLDNLILIEEEGGEEQVVEEFEGLSPPYWGLYPTSVVGETSLQPRGRAGNGLFIFFDDYGDLGEFGWIEVYPIGERPSVLVVDEGESAQPESRAREGPLLPVIVSSAFMEITQAEVGDRIGVWMGSKPFVLEVTGAVDYFPTMLGEKDAGYVIAPSNLILNDFNLTDYLSFNSNEFFISLDPGIPSDIVIDEIRDVVREDLVFFDKEDLRQMIKSDPLALGLRSITTLGYLLTSVLSLVGFGTYFYMSVRQRRKMYGVLRAIGMSASQIYGSLLLEQVVLILSGLALGTVLGVLLNQLTLPGLPLSLGGQPPIPPFLAETDWGGVFQIYFTLAIAFFISLGFATLSLSRARLHQVLRVDEE
jgi:hypothetical protein